MEKPHIITFFGTARMNLRDFSTSQTGFRTADDPARTIEVDKKHFKATGIRFVRMTTTCPDEHVGYEVLDKRKCRNVPILVSIDEEKLKRPIQIVWRHLDDAHHTEPYEGNPGFQKISDRFAKILLKDAMKVNPNTNELVKIYERYFSK
jgi:hypothetical protein